MEKKNIMIVIVMRVMMVVMSVTLRVLRCYTLPILILEGYAVLWIAVIPHLCI